MPIRKIADLPLASPCRHPEHNPPALMTYENGVYEHECPWCHHKQRFTVDKPTHATGPCRNRLVPEE
jgi:hypothetical protein